jgi:hypothetical protein
VREDLSVLAQNRMALAINIPIVGKVVMVILILAWEGIILVIAQYLQRLTLLQYLIPIVVQRSFQQQ